MGGLIMEKDRTMFGTKIKNLETNELGLLLYTWVNQFADGKVDFATCVTIDGKKYNVPLDKIECLEA
jgi:hypothetical protein